MNPPHKDKPKRKHSCEHCHERRYFTSVLHSRDGTRSFAQAEQCEYCYKPCSRCGGEGFVFLRDERAYRYASECPECSPLKRRIKAYNDAQLPARYRDKSFPNFEGTTDELMRVRVNLFKYGVRFMPSDKGFLLYGEPGCGKTHLLSAFIHHITLVKGLRARFVEFSHLLSTLRQQFDVGRGDTSVIQPLIEVDVLAIDELGKGVNNEWQLSVLDELISKRYNLGRTTLFTSNYLIRAEAFNYSDASSSKLRRAPAETLSERIGERIFSRLFEMTDFIHVEAPDFRKRKLKLV